MYLTKSDFMNYLECSCHLWLHKFHRDWLPELAASDRLRMEAGYEVDALAKQLFPGGVEVSDEKFEGAKNTRALIAEGNRILYQPTAQSGKIMCRADILVWHPKNKKWDLYEVKSSTGVKDEHIWDVAFQRLCFEKSKIPIGKTFLVHVDRNFVRQGEIDVEKFFIKSDITKEVEARTPATIKEIKKALEVFDWGAKPGSQQVKSCVNTKKCEYLGYYFQKLPAAILKTLDREIPDLSLPPEIRIGKNAIRKELDSLTYPLYFLDYETIGPAVPPFDGYRPFQQVPFQYSLDIQQKQGGKVEHHEYLASKFEDPVPGLAEHLRERIGPKGNVVAWYAHFESTCNDLIGRRLPKHAAYFRNVNKRMFDPMYLFKHRTGHYNHSGFGQSASLKKVLPILCPELAYDDLAIREGATASNSWFLLTGDALSGEEKKKLRQDMLAYCGRDTYAMVAILGVLERVE